MSERARLNMTTDDLELLSRVAAAQRDLHEIAEQLIRARTSTKAQRQEHGRKLNAIAASLRTVELLLEGQTTTTSPEALDALIRRADIS